MTDSATLTAPEASDEDLGDLLLEVVPPDGRTIGNKAAWEDFIVPIMIEYTKLLIRELIDQYTIEWSKVLGGSESIGFESDFAYDVDQSADTTSFLVGRNYDGNIEGFITKISPSGSEEWIRQFNGSIYADNFTSVEIAPDGSAAYVGGQVYIGNQWAPSVVYGQNYLGGGSDGFIVKYDSTGSEIWTRLFGGGGFDSISDLTVDPDGNVVATGSTNQPGLSDVDILTVKVDPDGNTLWSKTLSSSTSYQHGSLIATDASGAIYISGNTEGDLDGQSFLGVGTGIFVTKYDSAGTKQWTKLHSSSGGEFASGISIGGDGAIYLSGYTSGDLYGELNQGSNNEDVFLLKLDQNGDVDWTRMIGTSEAEYGRDIVLADDGYIYLAGYTFGDLGGNTNAGSSDIFVTRFSPDGSQGSVFLFGSPGSDEAQGLKVDQNGDIYVAGVTWGNPFNGISTNATIDRPDAFITKLSLTSVNSSGNSGGSSGGGGGSSSSPSATTTPTTSSPTETPSTPPVETPATPPATPATPAPTEESLVLGIQPQATVTTVELSTPLVLGNLQITKAVVGTNARDVVTGSDAGEVLAGGKGKDRMTGGGGSDAFVFETPGEFGKKKADTITDFRPEEGDKIAIAKEIFSQVSRIKLDTATGKQETKTAASTNKNFIYDDKSGILYFNENGSKAGFGNGGEFAKLLGAPEIGKGDLVLL